MSNDLDDANDGDDAGDFDAPVTDERTGTHVDLPLAGSPSASSYDGSLEAEPEAFDDADHETDAEAAPVVAGGTARPSSARALLEAASAAREAEPPPPPTEMAPASVEDNDADFAFDPTAGVSDLVGDRILPRISVHAFCTNVKLLGVIDSLKSDRRMQNVTIELHEGGVPRALELYQNETTPSLMIIEAAGNPRQTLAELDQLAEYCDESVRVFVIGATNDIPFYRELMRRGVSEYLVHPIPPVQLIRAISALFADPDAPFTGRTLAVTGVKGGVGASAIAHNLAWALTDRIKVNATLVDLDLNFGTTGLDFNQDSNSTIADVLVSPDRFDESIMNRILTKATDRLSLFTAPATLDRTYDIEPEVYARVLDQVRSTVPFVVLDLPHIWSDWFKATIMSSDDIIVVANPDLTSLRNGKNLIDFLKAARPNDSPPKLVLNMVGIPKRPEIPPKEFGAAIGLEPTLVLPFDPHLFGTAANNGQMIFDVAADNKCSQAIDQLASIVSGRAPAEKKSTLLKKILGR
ncbi:AAA family ATPase [bacterium]|nr:AAA family ATPase [bacterium]